MKRTIFYSWQSDLPNPTNRGLIEDALLEAAKLIAADDSLGVEPVIERDTAGVPGAPDIAAAILAKISVADIFVADVSIVNPGQAGGRATPNPNVLIELGYALRALGFERVVLVINTSFGGPSLLPFDLRARRAVLYQLAEGTSEKAATRHELASKLKVALDAALQAAAVSSVGPPQPSLVELAIHAIQDTKPNRHVAIRSFLTELVESLDSLAPPKFRNGGTVEQLETAIETTIPVIAEFTTVAQAAADMNDEAAAAELYKVFSPLFERYSLPVGFSGTWDKRDFDFYHFVGHEMLVTLFGCLLREGRWEIINELFAQRFYLRNHPSGHGAAQTDFTFGDWAVDALLETGRQRGRVLIHADILNARHTSGPLAALMPMSDFMAADYLLYLRAEVSVTSAPEQWFEWRPWSALYLREPPRFLLDAERKKTAARVAAALGAGDVDTLRQRLGERAKRLGSLFGSGSTWSDPVGRFNIDTIGSRD